MASTTLTFSSSSLCAATRPPHKQNPLPLSLSKPNFNFLSLSLSPPKHQPLTIVAAKNTESEKEPDIDFEKIIRRAKEKPPSSKIAFNYAESGKEPNPYVQKLIDRAKEIVEARRAEPPEPAPVVEPPPPAPKREEIFAVVMVGSRQYIVIPGRWIYTQRLKGASVNDKIVLNKVLLVGTKNSTYVGKPIVTDAAVHAVVEDQLLDEKVVVFKYKKKKNYRRNIGHRQPITRIRITGITGYESYPASTLPQ